MILENPVAKYMYETSPEVAEKPKKLFHATPLKNYTRIKEQGIMPHDLFGQTYMCEKKNNACVLFKSLVSFLKLIQVK